MNDEFNRGEEARAWWRTNISDDASDRGVRARLRRCADPREALLIPAALSLWRRLRVGEPGLTRALALAVVLAHVRHDDVRHPMEAAGWRRFPGDRNETDAPAEDRPLLSGLRFRRLLQSEGDGELIDAFRRLIHQLGEHASVSAIAASFLDWTHPVRGDRVRQDWAKRYFRAHVRNDETETEETDRP